MTDIQHGQPHWASDAARANIRRRRRSELWLKGAGLMAISIAFLMLFTLVTSLVATGWRAFTQTHVALEIPLSPEAINAEDPARANWRNIVRDAMALRADELGLEAQALAAIPSSGAPFLLRDAVVANPRSTGR
jgi:phosphate transport system permease protein